MINEEVQAVPLDEFVNRLLRRPVQYIVVEVPRYILHPCNVCAFGGFGLEAAPAQSDTDLADRLLRELTPERLGEAAGTDEELQEAPCVRSECSQYDEQEAIDLHTGGYRCEKMPPEAPTSAKKKLAAIAWQKLLGISAVPQPARNKCHGKKPKNRQNGRLHPHKNHRDEGGSEEAGQQHCQEEDSTWMQSWGSRMYPMRRPTVRATSLLLCGLLLAGAHFGTGLLPRHTGVRDTPRLVEVLGGREMARPEGVKRPPATTSEESKASRKEFARWLRDVMPDIELRDIRSAYRTADLNGDGIVDQDEAEKFASANF